MSLQDLVTDNLAADADESVPTLWEELQEDFSPREALLVGREALQSLDGEDWSRPVSRFAVRMARYQLRGGISLGTEIFVRASDAKTRPETTDELRELVQNCIDRLELEVRTSSAEEALSYLQDNYPDWDNIAGQACGVKPETIRRWLDGGRAAKTKTRKLYSLVRALRLLEPHFSNDEAIAWLRATLPHWNKTPLECISSYRYSQVPYEITSAIREL